MEQQFFNSEEEWKRARLGLFTSSQMYRLMAPAMRHMTEEELNGRPKKGPGSKSTQTEDPEGLSDGAITYIKEKAVEILAKGKPEFINYEMEWGKDHEAEAVAEFCRIYGFDLNSPDFLYIGSADPVLYTMANVAGGTPDAVMPEAIIEVKCPNSLTHFDYLMMTADTFRREVPEYFCQIQSNMIFTQKPKCFFVSYDPRFAAEELQLKVIEIEADYGYQDLIVKKITKAKGYLDQIIFRVFELNKQVKNEVPFDWKEFNHLRAKLL